MTYSQIIRNYKLHRLGDLKIPNIYTELFMDIDKFFSNLHIWEVHGRDCTLIGKEIGDFVCLHYDATKNVTNFGYIYI